MIGEQPTCWSPRSKAAFKTVADLVAAAKAKPGTLTFASAGIGSSSHMSGERLDLPPISMFATCRSATTA